MLGSIPQIIHAFKIQYSVLQSLAYNLYTPLEFYLWFYIFYNHVENKKNLRLLKISVVVYSAASLFFVFYFNIANKFIPEWVVLNNWFFTAWVLVIFFEQYAYGNKKSISLRDCFFWYFLGLLFYAPCTGMIFSMWDYVRNNNSLLKSVHAIFNINMYILFTIGFYKEYNLKKSVLV